MTTYEWTFEVTEEGNIIDSDFRDVLADLDITLKGDLGLVRNEGDEVNGLTDRLWAYVKDGELPDYFSDALGNVTSYKVPIRYKYELIKFLSLE